MSVQPVEIPDLELVRAIQRGDESALGALYDRYSAILFGLIVRIVNSRPEAEDILQQVFLQVWNRAASFDEARGKVFTWLVTLARSRAIDRVRALAVRAKAVDIAGQASAQVAAAVGDELVLRGEQREFIRGLLQELPDEQRTVLLLAYFEGLTQTEIAERLGQPLGTIKTRMRTALIRLREALKGRGQDLL